MTGRPTGNICGCGSISPIQWRQRQPAAAGGSGVSGNGLISISWRENIIQLFVTIGAIVISVSYNGNVCENRRKWLNGVMIMAAVLAKWRLSMWQPISKSIYCVINIGVMKMTSYQ